MRKGVFCVGVVEALDGCARYPNVGRKAVLVGGLSGVRASQVGEVCDRAGPDGGGAGQRGRGGRGQSQDGREHAAGLARPGFGPQRVGLRLVTMVYGRFMVSSSVCVVVWCRNFDRYRWVLPPAAASTRTGKVNVISSHCANARRGGAAAGSRGQSFMLMGDMNLRYGSRENEVFLGLDLGRACQGLRASAWGAGEGWRRLTSAATRV